MNITRRQEDSSKAMSAPPLGKYPYVKKVGHFIYLSGMSARLSDGSVTGASRDGSGVAIDAAEQTRAVLEKIKSMLGSMGADMSNCIDITTYLTDMRYFQAYNAVYATYFDRNGPVRTTVGVSELPYPRTVIEMKAVAYLP
ncbi:MAG TPA: RidA family protein [Nevskiaceae bacterium]|nr:RidA family protein [Nevskiaceae bacterium]